MAKGIRVNQLAKELGIESKSILTKLRDEGLSEKAQNHMSVLPLGLAESVREWFSSGDMGGGTAVETAAPVDVAVKPKKPRTRKKVEAPADETPSETKAPEGIVETAEAPPPMSAAPSLEQAPQIAKTPSGEDEEPPEILAPHIPPPTSAPPVAATAPSAASPKAAQPAPNLLDPNRPTVSRPTITLGPSRGHGPSVVERKTVVQAPQLTSLEPAKIQGPRVVREEKPESLPTPRPRRPAGAPAEPIAGATTARPQTGRGVKVSDEEEEEARKKAAGKAASGRTLSNRRRGPDGRRGEAMEKLREFSEQDLEERRRRVSDAAKHRTEFDRHLKTSSERGHHVLAKTTVEKGEPVDIEEPITVKSLAAALGVKNNDIITKLMRQGVFATVNQGLDHDTAETIALEYGIELHIVQQATLEEQFLTDLEEKEPDAGVAAPRPPVVTILGHVDHGKTSLLDRIRKANVAAGEAGGITQHTAAWMVQLGEKRVTFIDTPGHQAFTSMRARGANMTDVVVLVVSAAEGVQPQTVESINHAKAAEVPIVVAMNKIDRPDINEQKVLGELAANGLNPVEWGGDTEVIRTSATTGQGIESLIEILDYQAELLELKANPTALARGAVIESRMDPGLGPVATVLVQDGTLHVGDTILSGAGYGRIRMLVNDRGESITEAGPSTPVIVSGLNDLPGAGDKFHVLADTEQAKAIALERQAHRRQNQLAGKNQVTLDNLYDTMQEGKIKTINLIIKADVQGSVETLTKTVTDANTEEVRVRVIHAAVGGITESDIELADASSAVIIGFHVVPDEAARAMAEQRRVEVRLYRVIYEIFDDLKKALSGLLEPEVREKLHGHAEVRQVFKVSRVGNIAGCMVTDGHIQRGSKIRLTRDGRVITEDLSIETLRRIKEDVKEVRSGFECGIKLAGYDDIKIGDILEAYVRETFQRHPVGALIEDRDFMNIGVLQIELSVTDAMSLKDKRRVIKSLKDRIAHGHNVSIAEVGALDQHRRAILGVAMVSNDSRYVEGALSKLVDFVRTVPQVDLIDYQIELL